jgi:hypothetical protein
MQQIGIQNMKMIAAFLFILAFALPAFSQAITSTTDGTNPPIRTVPSKPTNSVPVVVTWDYYAQPKTLIVHALNNSGKDITGYTLSIRHKLPDGTLDKGGWSETTSDMLAVLVDIALANEPVEESERKSDHGIFFAGTTRDMPLNGANSGTELDITADVVFYADASFDKQNDDAFKRFLATRQGTLMAMKNENGIIKNALASPTSEHPTAAITELSKYLVAEMNQKHDDPFGYSQHMNLQSEIQGEIQNLPYLQRPREGTSERDRLAQYVEEREKRIKLMTPHCHLEIALGQ